EEGERDLLLGRQMARRRVGHVSSSGRLPRDGAAGQRELTGVMRMATDAPRATRRAPPFVAAREHSTVRNIHVDPARARPLYQRSRRSSMRSSILGRSSSLLFVLALWGSMVGAGCSAGTIGDRPGDGTSDDDLLDEDDGNDGNDGETSGGRGGAGAV